MKTTLQLVPSHRGRPPIDGLRQRILHVAEEIFGERDFHRVRMDDVARACGVAKGTLYLYFSGKRDLYLAVLFEGMTELGQRLESVADAPLPPLVRLRRAVACLLQHLWRRRPLLALLLRRDQRLEPREARQWLRRRERLSRIVQSAIEQAIAAGDLRRIDLRAGEEMLLGIVRGIQQRRGHEASIQRLTGRVMDLFLGGAGAERRRHRAKPRRSVA